jgi:ABC-2 type transport system ATP-binding protein
MAPAIRLQSAVVLLDRFPALSGVDLVVDGGEVLLVQGPNGAGKTTLLRACAGLAPIASGTVEVLGHDLRANRRAVRRHVGLLGHVSGLYDDLTVEENVRFAVRAAGGDAAGIGPVLTRLRLDGRLATTPASKLSAGQRRRTALAVLVARRPPLWLLDEPHAGLDAAARDVLDAVLGEVVADGATIVLVSHDAERAVPLATRRVTLVGGHVEPIARPAEPVHVA